VLTSLFGTRDVSRSFKIFVSKTLFHLSPHNTWRSNACWIILTKFSLFIIKISHNISVKKDSNCKDYCFQRLFAIMFHIVS